MERLQGRLLVATPQLVDPNFSRTVVLVLDHGDEGAFGLVVNRATGILVRDALSAWAPVASAPGVVFVGGPVGEDQAIGLALAGRADEPDGHAPGWAPLFAGIGSVDLEADPAAASVREFRLFVGYAGWSSAQLEAEIEEGSWFVADAQPPVDVFSSRPDRLWAEVLRRQPGRTAWFANFPEDLSTN